MGLLSDLKILYHMAIKPIRGKDHAARLESFYAGQADAYDDFRKRLLKGREDLCAAIHAPAQGLWVDMGGGTGANLEFLGERRASLSKIYVVDLSPSLLKILRRRADDRGWKNVEPVEADATLFQPPEGQADVVTFSYSLTMIPDWFAAIDNALRILKPGGLIGVVDFYVARKYPSDGLKRHSFLARSFWSIWFATDNVFLSPDHIPYLHRHFGPLQFEERRGKMPYMPFMYSPYYLFVGRKAGTDSPSIERAD